VLDGVDTSATSKKQYFGLTALMVPCLTAPAFMAGHAYSSAASASAIGSTGLSLADEKCTNAFTTALR